MLDFQSGEGMLMKYKKWGMQGAVGTKDNLVTMVTVKNQSQLLRGRHKNILKGQLSYGNSGDY